MYKLFIVDDEPSIGEYLTAKISSVNERWSVSGTADNGLEALQIIKNHPADLVITDIKMPVMDGITMCEKIKDIYPDQNFVILSGYDDFSYAQKAIGLGIKGYLLKPVKMPALTELLDRLADEIHTSREKDSAYNTLKKLLPSLPEKKENDEKNLVQETIEFIQSHFTEPITLKQIADVVNVSPNYLSRLFHETMGESYIKYITSARMNYAAMLLKDNPNEKILNIADKVGYYNLKHFNYVFKNYYKVTPSEYQKLQQ